MSMDDEQQAAGQWRPRGEDMTLPVVLLAKLFDRLGELTARKWAEPIPHGGKKPKIPEPFAQPLRALDLAKAAAEKQYLEELDDDVAAAQARWSAAQT